MGELKLSTEIVPTGPAAAIIFTDEQVASLDGGKAPLVRYTVNGQTLEGKIARMGGQNMLGLSRAVREQLGVEAGDKVDVTVVLDDQPRVYEAPPALAEALAKDSQAQAAWDKLAPSKRKEMARSITEAKQESTRERRIAKAIESLRS